MHQEVQEMHLKISDSFYWSGGDMSLYILSFNGDNVFFACADCSGGNIIKGISKYSISLEEMF